MDNDNISQQSDEIEVLKSIFEDQWEIEPSTGTYSIQIDKDVKLYITLNPDYPSDAPPKYELLAPKLTRAQKELIQNEFDHIYKEEYGNPIIFQWIEKLKEIVSQEPQDSSNSLEDNVDLDSLILCDVETNQHTNQEILDVTHGPTIVDRKSVFQGHACEVKDEEGVKKFMNYLLENKKIAQATHNISAYRILLPNSIVIQDCDDDGETHASVSRWYGGIHLGPDRFKHINNAARQVLVEGGFIKS